MELRDYQEDCITRAREAWTHGHRRPCIVIPCGGGKSVMAAEMAKRTTGGGKRVLFLVHRTELCEQITETFTGWGVDMDICSVSMVQTVCRHIDKTPPPDLIITDENHHCLASSYKKIYEAFPNAYGIGFTATPIRLNGGGLGDINDELVIGPTVSQLIKRECLSPFDYYAPQIATFDGVHIRNGDYITDEVEAVMHKPKIYGDVIGHYRKITPGSKAICYLPSIRMSKAMAEAFRGAGIPAAHIDGDTPKQERADTVQAFRDGKILVLCNVDLISEGFDVPDCGVSILLRPTKSLVLYIQQAMRCMRYQKGKRAVILDHVGNVSRFGKPDEPREWSLDTKPEVKEPLNPVKTCPECFRTLPRVARICKYCGHEFTSQGRPEIETESGAELQLIPDYTPVKFEPPPKSPRECHTVAQLIDYAAAHGYKKGWVWYRQREFNIWR